MSRNLGDTHCKFCHHSVALVEPPHPITPNEAGAYFENFLEGGLFAAAACSVCEAKYLAWVDLKDHRRWGDPELPFFDLSHRAAFNDEPAEEDLPEYQIEEIALTPAQCRALEAFSGTILRRVPWPRCGKTGRKIWLCYGCDCPEHRR